MGKTRLLAVTPPPEAFESMPSYLLRLASVNGLRTPVAIYARVRPGPRRHRIGFGFSVEDLSELTGWSPSVLAEIAQSCTFQDGERTVRKFADRLNSEQFRSLKAPAFCPMCAHEHGYIERVWDLSAVHACPLHGCWAVTHCASCGLPVHWERNCLTHCPCGAPYTDSVRADVPPALVLASAELILRASTHRQGPGYPEQLGFPSELWALSLRNTLRLQMDLARLVRTVEPEVANSLGIAVSGKALEQWPACFISILESYRASAGAEAVVSLLFDRKAGLFSRYQIANARPGQCLSFLAEAVFEFLNGDAPVFVDPRVQSRLFGTRRGRWRSLSYVGRQLGVGTQKLNQLADKGQVVTVVGAAPCRRMVDPDCITDDQVRALFRVNYRDAAKAIRLPLRTLKASLKDHLFGDFSQHRGVALGEIERIKQTLAEGAARTPVREDRSGRSHCKTMAELLNSPHYSTAFKAALVRHLLEGRLVAVACKGDSFRDLVLAVDELAVELGSMPTKLIHHLEVTHVAQMLWCSTMAVRELVEKGYLQESEHGYLHKITFPSCKQFQRKYISVREVGDLLGWSHRHLVHALGALRRPPVLLRLKRRAGWFVKRSSVPAVGQLAEQLLRQE
ncbi:TniQ family protein [Rhodanobacter koreensis]